MKKLLTPLIVLTILYNESFAQQKPAQFMQITTIESVVAGGAGRSRMVITNADGTQDERDMENLFSITGINFKNIRNNESGILSTLKEYTGKGWKLVSTVPLTLSPNQSGNGIFLTRYLLSKEEE
jgi:hypothetical protein